MSRGAFEPRLQPRWGQIRGDLQDQRDLAPLVLENGFDSRSESTISFVDGTRTFSISPVGDSFSFNSGGFRYIKLAPESLIIPDSEGIHFIYYDETGTLQSTQTFSDSIILYYAFTSIVYWDVDNSEAVLVGDERHGNQMNSMTHLYNHNTRGTAYGSGLQVGDTVATGNGDDPEDAQCSVGSGVIWDEDIALVISGQAAPANIPIVYRSGANGYWRKLTATDYMVTTTGSGRAAYNEYTGATWQLTEVGNLDHVLMHLYASDDITTGYFLVVGQETYGTTGQARDGALTELFNLNLIGLPVIEQLPVATFIFQTGNGYTNAVKSRLRETDAGDAFIDWRGQETGAIFAISGAITPTWGGIAGTLSNQLDLQAALDLKLPTSHLTDAGAHDAVNIIFDPLSGSGTIAAVDVQNAIEELEADIVALTANTISALDDKVNVAGDTMTGALWIETGDAGAFALGTSVDDLIIEGSDNTGITIATPNTAVGQLRFAAPGSLGGSQVKYDWASGEFRIVCDSSDRFAFNSAGNALFGDIDTVTLFGAEAGALTISTGNSGVTGAHASADDLVIESSGATGITICTPNTTVGGIRFADPEDSSVGRINYNHVLERMGFFANSAQNFTLLGSGVAVFGDINSVDVLGSQAGAVTISTADSTVTSVNSAADDLIIESNGNVGITIASLATSFGSLRFADPDAINPGMIRYNHTDDELLFTAGGNNSISLDANGLMLSVGAFGVNAIHMYKTSDQTLTGTYADITWNTEVEKETNNFSHSANSAIITVLETGLYKISLTISALNTDSTDRSGAKFRLVTDASGSYVLIPGTEIATYNRDNTTAWNTATVISFIQLDAGDNIKAQGYTYDGAGTIAVDADGTTITIERVR